MRKVDLSGLDRNPRNYIKWENSVGKLIPFEYEDIVGTIEIIDYSYDNHKVNIKYNNKTKWVDPSSIKNVSFGDLIEYEPDRYKYQIGQKIVLSQRDITILDRETRYYTRIKDNKEFKVIVRFYNIQCNKCKNTRWIAEKEIEHDSKCMKCKKFYTKRGINDIATLRPDLLPYFDDQNVAMNATIGSNKKAWFHCLNCTNHKKMYISYFVEHGFNCEYCDNVAGSYPEKFFQSFLRQLQVKFKKQLTHLNFEWIGSYLYDFYLYDYNTIIETHGAQHYEERINSCWKSLEEEQENDRRKQELALNNNIEHYITLDCRKSEKDWIRKSIMNSILPELLHFKEDDVDWDKCDYEAVYKNILIEICNYWNEHKEEYVSTGTLSKIFDISPERVGAYLKKGAELKICDYDPKVAFHNSKIQPRINMDIVKKISQYWEEHYDEGITTKSLESVFNLNRDVIARYLKIGVENQWCNYDPQKELAKQARLNGISSGKIVNVYNRECTKYINTYDSASETSRELTKIYEVHFDSGKIASVCRRNRNHHRNFVFRYDTDDEFKYLIPTHETNQNNTTT